MVAPDKKSEGKKETSILGIGAIASIVASLHGITSPTKIYAAMTQILYFYKLLPPEWKKKAYYLFATLWAKKKVIFSTNPDSASEFMNAHFEDARITQLFDKLPSNDKAVLLAGKSMMDLVAKGLHSDSYAFKGGVLQHHGIRGINIVDMITTGDIEQPLVEMDGKTTEERIKIFNWWADNYNKVALLVTSEQLIHSEQLESAIKERASSGLRKYIIINFTGTYEEVTKLISIVGEMKQKKKLNYVSFIPVIKEFGFRTCLNIHIDF